MRAVIYTNDCEPITVIELKPWMMELLETRGCFQLPVMEPLAIKALLPVSADPAAHRVRTVRLHGSPVRSNEGKGWMLSTANDEDALLLKSVFLPGQQRAVKNERAKARAEGFFAGMQFGRDGW